MQMGRRDARQSLQRLAFEQSGYFTAKQAREAGYSYQAQKYHADHGNWLRVDRGLFRLPHWPAKAEDTYVRWALWSAGRGVISHDSALAAHGLSDLDPTAIHLTVDPGFHATDDAVVLHHGHLDDDDVESRGAWRVTTPLRTLLDAATTAISQEHIESAVGDAISNGLITRRQLLRRTDGAPAEAALRLERALRHAEESL